MTHVKGGNDIHRVTRVPVHQVDETSRLSYTHATGMLSFNKIGPNITSEFLSNLQRAGFVLPDMPPDFEYFFIAMILQSHRSKKQ